MPSDSAQVRCQSSMGGDQAPRKDALLRREARDVAPNFDFEIAVAAWVGCVEL